MSKKNKILNLLSSQIALGITPIISAGCQNTKSKIKNELTEPNKIDTNEEEKNILAEKFNEIKQTYVTFKSSDQEYLKKNNTYYFRKLSYEPFKLTDEMYNFKLWKEHRPKMWVALLEADRVSEKFFTLGVTLKENEYTNGAESASGIWNIIRGFSKMDRTKQGVENGGHFNKGYMFSNKYEALESFLNEMSYYLDDIYAKDGIFGENEDKFNKEMRMNKDFYKEKLIYSASDRLPSKYIKEKVLDSIMGENGQGLNKTPKFYVDLMKKYNEDCFYGWRDDDAVNWFVLPFSFGTNEFINSRFATNNPYEDEMAKGDESYNNYNPIVCAFHQMTRFYLSELRNFDVYKNLIEWFKSFLKIDPDNKAHYWAEIKENNKMKLKKASSDLVRALVKFLDWRHLWLAEYEDANDKKHTLADLFAGKSLGIGETVDFEYTYKFAYEFLYDVLVPCVLANGWSLPVEFDKFEKELIDKKLKSAYIYDYIFNYLNVIFKDKYKDSKDLIKTRGYIDRSNREFWEEKFLKNFLWNWSSQFNLSISTEKIKN